jgi:hypothetical protein
MSHLYRKLGYALAAIAITGLSVGCTVMTETKTVETSDTYQLWSARMDRMPFLFHLPDGQLEAFDDRGHAWSEPASQVEASDADRVEVYVGSFSGLPTSLCEGKTQLSSTSATAPTANVVSALCDRSRTVVSFSDQARSRLLTARTSYIARTRHLLLNGIWKSVAQEPDPRPY